MTAATQTEGDSGSRALTALAAGSLAIIAVCGGLILTRAASDHLFPEAELAAVDSGELRDAAAALPAARVPFLKAADALAVSPAGAAPVAPALPGAAIAASALSMDSVPRPGSGPLRPVDQNAEPQHAAAGPVGATTPRIPAPLAGAGTAQPGALTRMLFAPESVMASGGRVGQGLMSMETNRRVTPGQFDFNAAGLKSVAGQPPAGPAVEAGSAPPLPASHIRFIVDAAKAAGIDPALLAATAARESSFSGDAYRAEPALKPVEWSSAPGAPARTYYDGSIGPTQVLRSNFIASGIDDDKDAYSLGNNYRISARIIRSNIDAFPGDPTRAVSAYNVGQYGARIGRVPANGYTPTILAWQAEYRKALAPYLP